MAYAGKNPFKIPRRIQYTGGMDTSTATGAVTLTKQSAQFQRIDPGGASRNVTLPAVTIDDEGYWFHFDNAADANESLVIKNAAGTTVITVLQNGWGDVYVDSTGAWLSGGAHVDSVGFASGIAVDVIAESTPAAGVTIDGLQIKDAQIVVAAGGSAFLDLSAVATGEADVILKDNLALALQVRESTNAYLDFVTTNDAERVAVQKLLTFPAVTTVAMADAAHALVLGTAGAGQTKLVGNVVFCDPDSSGASEILTLPAEASCDGLVLFIFNTGGEGIVVNEDGATTVITLDTAQHGIVACDGTTWKGFIGGVT